MTDSKVAIRPLGGSDIEQLVELDRRVSGQSRRGFFQKRFRAQERDAQAFISLGAVEGGQLVGALMAHLLDGEFGARAPVGVLDSINVDPKHQGKGTGRALMAALEEQLRAKGVREIRTQAAWNQPGLLEFFQASGFALAPRIVLERSAEVVNF